MQIAAMFVLAFLSPAAAPGVTPARAQLLDRGQEKVPIFDEQADAKRDIAAALARAKQENRRVLIEWGANW